MFELEYLDEANEQYFNLEDNPSKQNVFKQVKKALDYLKTNPRHPSLKTHKHTELSKIYEKEIFEAYAQNNTPRAYRIFFYYSSKNKITIITITPHP